jgi:hypothetical protein
MARSIYLLDLRKDLRLRRFFACIVMSPVLQLLYGKFSTDSNQTERWDSIHEDSARFCSRQ